MQDNQQDLLDLTDIPTIRRRKLLPWWIKVFILLFMFAGALVPLIIVMGLLGLQGQLALYGLETGNPFSLTGILLMFIFLLKAYVAYGLWTEKDWAVNAGIADAIIGIVICVWMMFVAPFALSETAFSFRGEILFLIAYLLFLVRVRSKWAFQI